MFGPVVKDHCHEINHFVIHTHSALDTPDSAQDEFGNNMLHVACGRLRYALHPGNPRKSRYGNWGFGIPFESFVAMTSLRDGSVTKASWGKTVFDLL